MKKLYSLIVILAILIVFPVTVFANKEPFLYKDNDTGVEFSVPANWTQEALSKEREFLDVKFTSDRDAGKSILYGSTDLWAELSSSERDGLSRSDLNNSVFSMDEIADAMGVTQSDLSKVTYGGSEYYQYVLGTTVTGLTRVENGYAYSFQFSGDKSNSLYRDFEALLESVTYPSSESTSSYDGFLRFSSSSIILSLLITITVYSLPIIIYRYCIVKHPVEREKAKKITIIYGIIAFIVMSILIFTMNGSGAAGGAILLWCWVNYKVLTNGWETQSKYSTQQNSEIANTVLVDTDNKQSTAKEEQGYSGENSIPFCYKCGAKLGENSRFCHKCGTKIRE